MDTPVLIPNTEVKLISAEGTWLDTARESMSMPVSKKHARNCVLFLLPENRAASRRRRFVAGGLTYLIYLIKRKSCTALKKVDGRDIMTKMSGASSAKGG